MGRVFCGLLVLGFLSASTFGASGSNCRLIVQVQFKDGKKRVSVEETGAASHEECRVAAQQRQLDSENDGVERVKVAFGYRELSILDDSQIQDQE